MDLEKQGTIAQTKTVPMEVHSQCLACKGDLECQNPNCQLCSVEPETIQHALFGCNFARATWGASHFGLTENLHGSLRQIMELMRNQLQSDRKKACTTIACATVITIPPNQQQQGMQGVEHGISSDFVCYVDGSWSDDGRAGVGLYLTKQGVPIRWVSKVVQAINPAQAEARAVLEACILLQQLDCQQDMILSDSAETLDSLSHTPHLSYMTGETPITTGAPGTFKTSSKEAQYRIPN